jgi:hypothetical protein
MYKHYTEVRSRIHYCRVKTVDIIYSVCVSVAFVIQHAMGMRRVTPSFVACLAVLYHIFHIIS